MPIRPENLSRYPVDWPAISYRIRNERAGGRCEECGVGNYEIGGRDENGKFRRALPLGCDGKLPAAGTWAWCQGNKHLRIVRIVLTVAHLDHQPENCADENLRAWCQRCHNRYDRQHRQAGIEQRRREGAAVADLFELAA